MDLRNPVLAIIVGGSPAPGINAVITAVTLEAMNNGLTVIGIKDGFKSIKKGQTTGCVHRFVHEDVTGLYHQGGSFLRTSREKLNSTQEVDNVLRVLEHLRVRYLVTIGGTITAYSASLVASAARAAQVALSIVHVPKSIFNDLPLPEDAKTFGYETAREVGVQLVHNLKADARTMQRWYIVVVMGQKAGHLTLGIGKAAAATLTIIPEEYKGKKLVFSELCDMLQAAIHKRAANGREYGVVVLCEGLVDLMDEKEMHDMFGDADTGHQDFGRTVSVELTNRLKQCGQSTTLVARNLGNELRAANPNATDTDLARDLGYGATRFLLEGGTGCMVTLLSGGINAIPLSRLLDPRTGMTQIRLVDTSRLSYEVARKYMIRLRKSDFLESTTLNKMAAHANLSPQDFVRRFEKVAEDG